MSCLQPEIWAYAIGRPNRSEFPILAKRLDSLSWPLVRASTGRWTLRYSRLGNSDLVVSVVALGCGNFGGIGSVPELFGYGEDETQAVELLDAARDEGITLLDTANSYGGGRSEEWIGRWLHSRGVRDDIVLSTKVGGRVRGDSGAGGLSARHVREQVEASLRRLRTDYLDLYLAHVPNRRTPIEETLAAFDALVRAGKIRHFGVCNYTGAQVAQALAVADKGQLHRPANLQCRYSLFDRDAAAVFRSSVLDGFGCTAYSPLAGGWLAGEYQRGQPYPPDSRMGLRPEPYRAMDCPATFTALDALRDKAQERGVSLPTLALAWVLTDPMVTAAIIGPRRPEELAPAVAAVEHQLTGGERADLTRIAMDAGR